MLPIDIGSALSGWIVQKFGRRMKCIKVARHNIKTVMPHLTEAQVEDTISGMLNNFGRMFGEFPHLHNMSNAEFSRRVQIEGTIDKNSKCCVTLGAHIANFELYGRFAKAIGMDFNLVYREANNFFIEPLINYHRKQCGVKIIKKGTAGMRNVVKALKKGEFVFMLPDQNMNNGIVVPFLGKDAKTTPAPANLALRYGATIPMIQIIRTKGAYFKIIVHEPLKIYQDDDVNTITKRINDEIGRWVLGYPHQWFWVHRRWGKF